EYQVGRVTGVASVNFGQPVLDTAGGVTGVVYAAVPLTWLQGRLAGAELPEGSEVLVINGEATVLARYPRAGAIGASLAGTTLAPLVEVEEAGIVEAEGLDGVRRL